MGHQITDDTYDAAALTIVRQALGDLDVESISIDEAAARVRRAQRITECERYGVPVRCYETNDLKRIARRLGLEL